MKSRILAFLCVLALLVGLLPVGTGPVVSVKASAAETTYDVGYAIKNFNPWVAADTVVPAYNEETETWYVPDGSDIGTVQFLEDPENTANKKIYPYLFSQNGNQIDWESVVTGLHDDNGDGVLDHNDGIFATSTAVTYGKGTEEEKTVLFITTDTMKAWTDLVEAVRKKIVASDWGKELGITADSIMVCSNHTHSGPLLNGSVTYYIDSTVYDTDEKKAALKEDRKTYYNWVVDRIVAAAKESVQDQSPATMSKGAVNATEATAARNYNGGKGYHMNAIRHYERSITATKKLFGRYELDSETIYSIYANTTVPSEQKLYNALSENQFEKAELFNPEQFLTDTSYTTSWSTTDEADNTMYVLRFEFEDSAKDPVVFVNWRAHSTMNSGVSHHILSGDYANGLRTVLAGEGYRAAFFQGAAGNVVPHPSENVYKVSGTLQKDKMDWLYEASNKSSSSLTVNSSIKTFVYGRMLAEIAKYCMEETNTSGQSYMMDTPVGEIRTYQESWVSDKNVYEQELLDAAIALRTEVMNAKGWDKATFDSNYATFFKNNSSTYFPYYYKPSGKTAAIINSRLHFSSVYSQAKTVVDNGKTISGQNAAMKLDAIMLGENVAFITSPNELADYYHDFTNDVVKHTSAQKEAHNDWRKLEDDNYGMPFVLGYSNQNSGYIAGWLDHQANSKTHSTITGLGADGYMLYSPGTYESMTSSFAAGQGEELIDFYDQLLDKASGVYDRKAPCPHCSPDEDVTWKPLFENQSNTTVGAGHFYLHDNLSGTAQGGQWSIGSSTVPQTTCIDLNGKTKFSESRNFIVNKDSVLSIMDSVGTGRIHSQTYTNNPGGGNISVSSDGTFNLYGGTLSFTKLENPSYYGVGIGGIVSLQGTMNMYGGTIEGADLTNSSYTSSKESTGTYFTYNGSGGAVYVYGSGKLNVYGGKITSGTVPETVTLGTLGNPTQGTGKGPCVFLAGTSSRILLSGDAKVEDIYYSARGGAMLTVSDTYTGTAALTFDPAITITDNMDIGNSSNAVLTGSTITCTNNPFANIYVQGTNLLLSNRTEDTVAMVYGSNGVKAYNTLSEAISNFDAGYIRLVKNETASVSVTKDAYLDLAGFSVTGQVTVAEGKTLYCMDSNTDDYTVKDGKGYGKIASYTGKVAGVPEEATCAEDGYVMVTEAGGVSFHRLNLQLKAMTLRPQVGEKYEPGIYYKSYFAGDEVVADEIDSFGVALSLNGTPSAETLDTKCQYSTFENFVGGSETANENNGTGTLLKGIMKETNLPLQNGNNANRKIYGRAYAKLSDGTYMFGTGASRTLRQQVEAIDAKWNTLDNDQRTPLAKMCANFENVTKNWQIPNILSAVNSGENEVLKVLVIGNSHGLDATNLLYEVFETEAPEQKVVLGALYYSGCNMQQHANYITNNTAAYDYYKNDGSNADGSWTITKSVTAQHGLQDEIWDIVVMQQMNHRAGLDSDYVESHFRTVKNYILNNTNPDAEIMWHMVWSNPDQEEYLDPDSPLSHPTKTSTSWVDNHNAWFPGANGSYDMDVLYNEILRCTQTYVPELVGEGTVVLPSATAVQYGLSKLNLTQAQIYRDYTHMNDYGRLMVAYLWYAKLMGIANITDVNVSEIPTVLHHPKSAYPADLQITEEMQDDIVTAVNWALRHPYTLN